jgi:glycoprotein endo-alpha-1,2-mannosidase
LVGCYSSTNVSLIHTHMQMLNQAGIGTLVVSWYPPSFSDSQIERNPGFSNAATKLLLDIANQYDIKVSIHVEPYPGRSARSVAEDIRYIVDNFGTHPALYRHPPNNLPMFYVYDSYLTSYKEWAEVLGPATAHKQSIRGGPYDAVVIALFVNPSDYSDIPQGFFDGVYTYFASDGFTHGSTASKWAGLAKWARDHRLLFVPSVGPGYDDTRIRPWNARNAKSREESAYYHRMWTTALELDTPPPIVSITSWNEWHEGTQIEPAAPGKVGRAVGGAAQYQYLDYRPLPPDHYLTQTRQFVTLYHQRLKQSQFSTLEHADTKNN